MGSGGPHVPGGLRLPGADEGAGHGRGERRPGSGEPRARHDRRRQQEKQAPVVDHGPEGPIEDEHRADCGQRDCKAQRCRQGSETGTHLQSTS